MRARDLLDSGAAHEAMQRIINEQGPPPEKVDIGTQVGTVIADADGIVNSIDCFALSGIARAAGAPFDKGAGLDLFVRIGDKITVGTPLYRIHARHKDGPDAARRQAANDHAFRIDPDGAN